MPSDRRRWIGPALCWTAIAVSMALGVEYIAGEYTYGAYLKLRWWIYLPTLLLFMAGLTRGGPFNDCQ